jgi:Type IV secretion-system coupling protein DNA-binding domain
MIHYYDLSKRPNQSLNELLKHTGSGFIPKMDCKFRFDERSSKGFLLTETKLDHLQLKESQKPDFIGENGKFKKQKFNYTVTINPFNPILFDFEHISTKLASYNAPCEVFLNIELEQSDEFKDKALDALYELEWKEKDKISNKKTSKSNSDAIANSLDDLLTQLFIAGWNLVKLPYTLLVNPQKWKLYEENERYLREKIKLPIYKMKITASSNNSKSAYVLASMLKPKNSKATKHNRSIYVSDKEINSLFDFKGFSGLENKEDLRESLVLGKTVGGKEVSVSFKDLKRGLTAIGQPGSGKSGGLINYARQTIDSNKLTLVIDPHRETLEELSTQVKSMENVEYLRAVIGLEEGDQEKLGYNLILCTGNDSKKDALVSDILKTIFPEATTSTKNELHNIAIQAQFLIRSAVYFFEGYKMYLEEQGCSGLALLRQLKEKQLTLTDLGDCHVNKRKQRLFARILKYNRPDLAERWQIMVGQKKAEKYLDSVCGRIAKLATDQSAVEFFESRGFNVVECLLKGKHVFADLLFVNDFLMELIIKAQFSRLLSLHKGYKLRETFLFIDEARLVEFFNLHEMLEQARKFGLACMLFLQRLSQMKIQENREALTSSAGTKLLFKGDENPEYLETREFNCKTPNIERIKLSTIDFTPSLRPIPRQFKGIHQTELNRKIKAKEADILAYFGIKSEKENNQKEYEAN